MILILTPYSFNPLHPRLEYIEKTLIKNGYSIKKYNLQCSNRIINKLNWLSLTFFQVPSFFKSIKYLWLHRKETKLVYIQDLQYLHIAIIAKLFRKRVIYDTLDNNVELNFYHLSNRFEFLKKMSFIKSVISFLEKKIAYYFADTIVVNSKALVEYFKPIKSELLYYTSPFEKKFEITNDNEVAFLYLGAFSVDKGANEILDFISNKYRVFIFGNTSDVLLRKITKKDNISYINRISSEKLINELKGLYANYRLIGFSLIKDVHYSYKTQEANKDIDYLAMKIPIIGNYRKPTKEKIEAGCGVFFDNKMQVDKLINDKDFYKKISDNCESYYNKFYSQTIFEKNLLKVIDETK